MKTLNPNEEIHELGNMLFATTAEDAPRLLSICKRVSEIAAASTNTVTDQEGRVHLEASRDGWLPIATAPRDGLPFLASGKDRGKDGTRHFAVAWWHEERGEFVEGPEDNQDSLGTLLYLTHWRPLPVYPESTSKEP